MIKVKTKQIKHIHTKSKALFVNQKERSVIEGYENLMLIKFGNV